jgi:Domain of unknown function (DUF1883)
MNYLHYDLDLNPGEVVEVDLDKQANVRLLDDTNFSRYKKGERHDYFGGRAVKSPARIHAPHAGRWHLVVDLGGYSGQVRAAVRTVNAR